MLLWTAFVLKMTRWETQVSGSTRSQRTSLLRCGAGQCSLAPRQHCTATILSGTRMFQMAVECPHLTIARCHGNVFQDIQRHQRADKRPSLSEAGGEVVVMILLQRAARSPLSTRCYDVWCSATRSTTLSTHDTCTDHSTSPPRQTCPPQSYCAVASTLPWSPVSWNKYPLPTISTV